MLIQLDDNTIINPKQVLWAFRDQNSQRYVSGNVELCYIGRNGEEKRTVYDACGRVWAAIKKHAEGNG